MKFIVAQRTAGGLYQAGINRNPFVDGKPFGFELAQDLGVLPRYKFRQYSNIFIKLVLYTIIENTFYKVTICNGVNLFHGGFAQPAAEA